MKLTIELGPLAPKLNEQLAILGRNQCPQLARLQLKADALSLLYVGGLLTDAEHERAGRRLLRQIQQWVG